jgi:hypothetical protein
MTCRREKMRCFDEGAAKPGQKPDASTKDLFVDKL